MLSRLPGAILDDIPRLFNCKSKKGMKLKYNEVFTVNFGGVEV